MCLGSFHRVAYRTVLSSFRFVERLIGCRTSDRAVSVDLWGRGERGGGRGKVRELEGKGIQ